MEVLTIFTLCIIGVGYTSYKIGVREGAEKMLERLQEIKIIDIDDEGKISPKINL
jgi:hypothetical protein